jgi:hypothetical protein
VYDTKGGYPYQPIVDLKSVPVWNDKYNNDSYTYTYANYGFASYVRLGLDGTGLLRRHVQMSIAPVAAQCAKLELSPNTLGSKRVTVRSIKHTGRNTKL